MVEATCAFSGRDGYDDDSTLVGLDRLAVGAPGPALAFLVAVLASRQPAVSSRPERPGFSLNPFASSHTPRAR